MARTRRIEDDWHLETLPPATRDALAYLAESQWFEGMPWYLAGGTALALQAGHRESVDLDFFTERKDFSLSALTKQLEAGAFTVDIEEPGTLYGRLHGAQVSFIAYPFFKPKEPMLRYGAVSVLHARDIAVMKIIAISQRGRKRDFIDLYWYSKNREPLLDVMRRLPAQYPSVAHDYQHLLKALIYFEDAESDPMPTVHFDADWSLVTAYFRAEVPRVAKTLLKLAS